MSGRPWMHVDPRQLPTDLKEPAMDAGYPPDRSGVDYHAYVERELNKAIDETARLRNYLDDFTRAVIDLDAGRGGNFARAAHSVRKKAELPPVEVSSDDR